MKTSPRKKATTVALFDSFVSFVGDGRRCSTDSATLGAEPSDLAFKKKRKE